METDWRAELEACDGFTEKQKGIVKAKLLACEEQGGDTDTAFMWIKTALEVQSDGAELSGNDEAEAGSKKPDTAAQAEGACMKLADLFASIPPSDRPSGTGNAKAKPGSTLPDVLAQYPPEVWAAPNMPTRFPAPPFPSDRPSETGNADAKTGSMNHVKLAQEFEDARMRTARQARVQAWLSSSDGPSETGNTKANANGPPHADMQMPHLPTSFTPSDKPSVTGNADAKAGSKTRDKLAQELELRMQRERLLASHQMECLLVSQSRSKWPSETGGQEMPGGVSNNYIVRVLGENGWAWLSRCKPPPPPPPLPPPPSLQSLLDTHKEHCAKWGAAAPPVFPSSAATNSTRPPSAWAG
ncbi:g3172 [Coccomyxa viridis]|uniref:G3172 protein n=1 Tax=Coccomyxa viridis TaxID=1274662 RepID=A0ABP1FM57_9CHLO